MAPFGRDNPEVVLRLQGVRVGTRPETFGRFNKHLSLRLVGDSGRLTRAVGWNFAAYAADFPQGTRLNALVEPKLSRWNGNTSVELRLIDMVLA
jgi:hypothetical protein